MRLFQDAENTGCPALPDTDCPAPFTQVSACSCLYGSSAIIGGWEDAKTECINLNGHLAFIKTLQQQQDVESFLSTVGKST